MKKTVFYVFAAIVTLCLLIGCDGQVKPQPQPGPGEEVDTVTASIDFVLSKNKTHFYINDNNATQTIAVSFYDKNGNRLSDSKVRWESNLPEETKVVSSENALTFEINSVNVLGDYSITATVKGNENIKKSYSFTLLSRDELVSSLSYSYASDFEVAYNEDGSIKGIVSALEYDESGARITSEEARMVLNDSLDYRTNGTNLILVTTKDGANFGKLEASSSSEALQALSVGQNAFVLLGDGVTSGEADIVISAGSKDSRSVRINLDSTSTNDLTAPSVSALYKAEGDGVCVDLKGDNVSTQYYAFEGGNTLIYKVLRMPYSGSEEYEEYSFFENEESGDIKYGYKIHLRHCGRYRIEAYLVDNIGYRSETTVSEFVVRPYQAPDLGVVTLTTNTPVEKINSQNLWESYISGQEAPKADFYTLTVANNDDTDRYYGTIEYKNDELEINDYNTSFIVLPNQVLTQQFATAGEYHVTIYKGDSSEGYGFPMDGDDDTADLYEKTFIIQGYSYYENKSPIEITTEGTEVHVKPGFELDETETVYVGVYINGGYVSGASFSLSAGDPDKVFDNSTYDGYSFKAYVFTTSPRLSSVVSIFDAPWTVFSILPDVRTELKEVSSGRQVDITVINKQTSTGHYRKLSYAITSDGTTVPTVWRSLGTSPEYTLEKTTHGTQYYWVKLEPLESENATGYTTVCKQVDLDLSINAEPSLVVRSVSQTKKKVTITNTQDNSGHFRYLFYAWNESPTVEPTTWFTLGNQGTYEREKTTEGLEYLWVKSQPSDFENLIGYTAINTGVSLNYPEFAETPSIVEEYNDYYPRKEITIINRLGSDDQYRNMYYAWADSPDIEPAASAWIFIQRPEQYIVYMEYNGTSYLWVKSIPNDDEGYADGKYSLTNRKIVLSVPLTDAPTVVVNKGTKVTNYTITNVKDTYMEYRNLYYSFTETTEGAPSTWTLLGNSASYYNEVNSKTLYLWVKIVANDDEKCRGTNNIVGPFDVSLEPVKLSSYASPQIVDTSDSVQDAYGVRKVLIKSTVDENGKYRPIRYQIDSGTWSSWQTPPSSGVKVKVTDTEGSKKITVEMKGTENDIGEGVITVSKTVTLSKIKRPRVRIYVKTGLSGRIITEFKCTAAGLPGAYAYATGSSGPKTNYNNSWMSVYSWSGWLISNNDTHSISAYQRAYGYINSISAGVSDAGTSGGLERYDGDE